MAFQKRELKRWRDIELGSTVFLRDKPWTLVEAEKVADGVAVTVKHKNETARTVVGKKAEVETLVPIKPKPGESELGAIVRTIEKKAKPAGPLLKPDFDRDEAGWYKAPKKDKAEAVVREVLKAELVGVQLGPDEAYTVPLVDLGTIASHLFLFHGIGPVDVLKLGGWVEARDIHLAEHADGAPEPKIPHFHEANRPSVTKGPRFR